LIIYLTFVLPKAELRAPNLVIGNMTAIVLLIKYSSSIALELKWYDWSTQHNLIFMHFNDRSIDIGCVASSE